MFNLTDEVARDTGINRKNNGKQKHKTTGP